MTEWLEPIVFWHWWILAGILLIPSHGGAGAAMAVLAQRAVSCVALIVIGLAKLRKYNPQPDA